MRKYQASERSKRRFDDDVIGAKAGDKAAINRLWASVERSIWIIWREQHGIWQAAHLGRKLNRTRQALNNRMTRMRKHIKNSDLHIFD